MKRRRRSKYEGLNASDRARASMRHRGVTPNGYSLWTKEEDRIVRELYPDYVTMKKLLRRRSRRSLSWRAGVLGLRTIRLQLPWTGREVTILRRRWREATRTELVSEFPRHPWGSIAKKGQSFGIRRRPWTPKPTGLYVLDQIRARAAEQKTSLCELDRVCSCRGYFENSSSQPRWPRHNILLKAIAALGGHVEIVWE